MPDPSNTAVSDCEPFVVFIDHLLSVCLSTTEILATLLNDGKSPTTGFQLLQCETVTHMFTNQIPQFPDFGRQGIPAARSELTNPIPDLYPQPPEQPQGWGLTFMLTIHEGATGRGQNTGWWAGLPNLFWWCDREQGVAGIIASQIVPFGGESELISRICMMADMIINRSGGNGNMGKDGGNGVRGFTQPESALRGWSLTVVLWSRSRLPKI